MGPQFNCQTMSISTIQTLPVTDLHTARQFYVHTLGCLPGRLDEATPHDALPDKALPDIALLDDLHIDKNHDVLLLDFMGHPLLLVRNTDKSARLPANHPIDGATETLAANDSEFGSHSFADTSAPVIIFILGVDDWCTTAERLQAHNVDVTVAPSRRFSIAPGEQCAMTVHDPDGNCIELRGFAADESVLAA